MEAGLKKHGDYGCCTCYEHKYGNEPTEECDDWMVCPFTHDFFVAAQSYDEEEDWRCNKSVSDSGVDKCGDWINSEEVYTSSDEHGNNNDSIKGIGVLQFSIESRFPAETFCDSV